MQKRAGILMIAGAIIFVAAPFQPAITAFFMAASQEEAVAVLEANARGWAIGNLLFLIGALFASAGVVLLAAHIRAVSAGATTRRMAAAAAGFTIAGAILWAIISISRIVQSPEQAVYAPLWGAWLFPAYAIVSLLGLILAGVAMLKAGYNKLLSWYTIGFHLFLLIVYLLTWNTAPIYWYMPLAIIGLALLFVRPRAAAQQPSVAGTAA